MPTTYKHNVRLNGGHVEVETRYIPIKFNVLLTEVPDQFSPNVLHKLLITRALSDDPNADERLEGSVIHASVETGGSEIEVLNIKPAVYYRTASTVKLPLDSKTILDDRYAIYLMDSPTNAVYTIEDPNKIYLRLHAGNLPLMRLPIDVAKFKLETIELAFPLHQVLPNQESGRQVEDIDLDDVCSPDLVIYVTERQPLPSSDAIKGAITALLPDITPRDIEKLVDASGQISPVVANLSVSQYQTHDKTLHFVELGTFLLPGRMTVASQLAHAVKFAAGAGTDLALLEKIRRIFWELLPQRFHDLYWFGLGSIPPMHRQPWSLLISSESWHFPWELVQPRPSENGWPRGADRAPAEMLGAAFAISRWVPERKIVSFISPRRMAMIHDGDSQPLGNPPEADNDGHVVEVNWHLLEEFVETFRLEPSLYAPFPTIDSVITFLKAPDAEIVHLRGHGSPTELVVRDDGVDNGTLVVSELKGKLALDREGKSRFVFLNACETANGLEMVEEWPDLLLEGGAAAFVVTIWNIDNDFSDEIVQEFYRHMSRGKTIAEAAQYIRCECLDVPDARTANLRTRLSFVVFGDPNAKIV